MKKLLLLLLAIITFLIVIYNYKSKSSGIDPKDSSLRDLYFFNNQENGYAYDRAALDLSGIEEIIVPEDTVCFKEKDKTYATIYIEKLYSHHGHLVEKSSIREVRRRVGCATLKQNRTMTLAICGAFSTIEGGISVKLATYVPESITIKFAPNLNGRESIAISTEHYPKEDRPYNSSMVDYVWIKKGWIPLLDSPDPECHFRTLLKNWKKITIPALLWARQFLSRQRIERNA